MQLDPVKFKIKEPVTLVVAGSFIHFIKLSIALSISILQFLLPHLF